MPRITRKQATGLAEAFIESINKATAKQKEQMPTTNYGESFNRVLESAKEVASTVDDGLWPKPVGTLKREMYDDVCNARYLEIETYARQIVSLLKE